MKPMKKTDIWASVLYDAMVTINGIPDLLKLSTSEIDALKNSEDKGKAAKEHLLTLDGKSIFMTEDDALEELFPKRKLIRKLTEFKSLFWYRILPAYNIDIEGKDMDDVYTDLYLANQYTGGDYYDSVVWKVLQEKSISLKDLEYEFWENCRLDQINEHLGIPRVKFSPVTSKIYDLKKFSTENLFCTNNQYKNGLSNLSAIGVITPDDAVLILKMIHFIAKEIKFKISSISSMYNELKKMQPTNSKVADLKTSSSEPTNGNAKEKTEHLNYSLEKYDAEKLLNGLVEKGYLEADLNSFAYWFGGGIPPNDLTKINWIKKNSRTHGYALNKKSLLDLLRIMEVPNSDIQNKILLNNIFDFKTGSKLKNNNYTYESGVLSTKSEYHEELKEIVKKSKR